MKTFIAHIEIWLSIAGVAVILLVPAVIGGEVDAYWRTMAVTAIAVGVLHGLIFWVVRRRQARLRQEAIDDIRGMLLDRIPQHLTVIMGAIDDTAREDAEQLQEAVLRIQRLVQSIDARAYEEWVEHFGLQGASRPEGW